MQVGDWLREIGLAEYADAFAENRVDAGILPELTNEDLKDLGVLRLGDRKRILKAIANLDTTDQEDRSPSSPPRSQDGERRQVTVMFVDMTGFTQLSKEMGAEGTHHLLNRYFETVDGVIQAYGGSIDKHIGDSAMAIFGAPVAHTDDPERAARASFDIHEAMSDLSEEFGRSLHAHIGIASGQVVASGTGSDAHREYTVTGDSVNLASRLQDKAQAAETLVSEPLYRMVQSLTDCEPVGEIEVKGVQVPVSAWRLIRLKPESQPSLRGPFVGRRSEQRQFRTMVEECLETGSGQTILVRGEAGIGKTRLVEEFVAIAKSYAMAPHKGLVLDFGVGKGQDAVRSLVRSFLGLAPGSGKADRLAAMDKQLESEVIPADDRVFMNDLLDLPQPTELRSLYDAMDNQSRNSGKQEAVGRLVRGAAARNPVLITVEDIQWAQGLTLEHLAHMASTVAGCSAILVMTSRLEGDPLDQAWRSSMRGTPLTTIDLQPLRETEAEELASGFSESSGEFVRACITRAEGNPLFLEQLLRHADDETDGAVPGSIQSVVQTRLDHLANPDRRALQAASVIGQRFELDALRHLADDPLYDPKGLLDQSLIRPEANGFLFAHALIREGVYDSLLTDQRQRYHHKAAEWFGSGEPELQAEHLERAGDPAAARAYLSAAEANAAAYRLERALDLAERARALASEQADIADAACCYGRLLLDRGATEDALSSYRDGLDESPDNIHRTRALIGYASGLRIKDDYKGALQALGEAQGLAETGSFDEELAEIHYLRGNIYFPLGRHRDCLAEHEQALTYATQTGSRALEVQALGGLADGHYAQGTLVSAGEFFGRSVTLAKEIGLGRIEVANSAMLGHVAAFMLDPRQAVEHALQAIDMASRVGHARAESVANRAAAQGYYELGQLDEARRHVENDKAIVAEMGFLRFKALDIAVEAAIDLAEGNRPEALSRFRLALEIGRKGTEAFSGPWILGGLAYATDDPEESATAIAEGRSLLARGAVSHNTFWFYRFAIETALRQRDWGGVETFAAALENAIPLERLPWPRYFAARGRLLAGIRDGRRDGETRLALEALIHEATERGLHMSGTALKEALQNAEWEEVAPDDEA